MMANIDNSKVIREAFKDNKVLIGTEQALKNLKLGRLDTVFLSKNVPNELKDEIKNFSEMSDVKVIQLEMQNDELGTFCKKPFPISVLSIKKV